MDLNIELIALRRREIMMITNKLCVITFNKIGNIFIIIKYVMKSTILSHNKHLYIT